MQRLDRTTCPKCGGKLIEYFGKSGKYYCTACKHIVRSFNDLNKKPKYKGTNIKRTANNAELTFFRKYPLLEKVQFSGAAPGTGGDFVLARLILIDLKTTKYPTYTLTKRVWDKLTGEAKMQGLHPCIVAFLKPHAEYIAILEVRTALVAGIDPYGITQRVEEKTIKNSVKINKGLRGVINTKHTEFLITNMMELTRPWDV